MIKRRTIIAITACLLGSGPTMAGNVAHERLAQLPPDQQALSLGRAVGEGCQGKVAFLMGLGTQGIAKDQAFWNVMCADGRSFEVMIAPDAAGSTTVIECQVLQAMGGGTCFKKFPK